MPDATIQGEFHGSQGDKYRLKDHGFENYDQLFIEGRAPFDLRKESTSFAIFLIGTVFIFWIEWLIAVFARLNARLFTKTPIDVRQEAHDSGLDFDDDIDLALDEMYDKLAEGRSRTLFNVILLLIPVVSISTFWELILFEISRADIYGIASLLIISAHIVTFVFINGAFFYVGAIIFTTSGLDKRDQRMAESITEKSSSGDYDRILISCGDKHVPGIARKLREDGWGVDSHRSGHWISRIARWFRSRLS